jgi:TPR repeat protein
MMCQMAKSKRRLIEGDYDGAFEYWTKAAGLGHGDWHYRLADFYRKGQGVEKDEKRELHHLEEAAIGGHPGARFFLGRKSSKVDRAMRHFIIASKLGLDASLEMVKDGFKRGLISKEDYASALRGHQAALDATKSPQREAAEEALRKLEAAEAAQ